MSCASFCSTLCRTAPEQTASLVLHSLRLCTTSRAHLHSLRPAGAAATGWAHQRRPSGEACGNHLRGRRAQSCAGGASGGSGARAGGVAGGGRAPPRALARRQRVLWRVARRQGARPRRLCVALRRVLMSCAVVLPLHVHSGIKCRSACLCMLKVVLGVTALQVTGMRASGRMGASTAWAPPSAWTARASTAPGRPASCMARGCARSAWGLALPTLLAMRC